MNAELSWIEGGARRYRDVTVFPDAQKGKWRFQLPPGLPAGVSLLVEVDWESE